MSARVDVGKLQRQLDLSWGEIERLKQENATLKRTIRAALPYWPSKIPENLRTEIANVESAETESWPERSEHFEQIREATLEVALALIRREGRAVHYDEVNRGFRARHVALYNQLKNPQDTISRRLRELRDAGYLVSPEQGLFFIGRRLAGKEA